MDSANNNDNITAAYAAGTAIIRVEGRGSFKISPPMKQFIHKVIDEQSAKNILIEMSKCTGMDSTFMGLIAGIACYLKSKPEISFELINLSERNQKLLITLGVDRVVTYSMSATEEQLALIKRLSGTVQSLKPEQNNKLEAAKTTLEAHETLVDINPDNLIKFRSVLEYLQDDVRKLSK
ncbi:MAG: STAS domain-containing protein [Pontiellaceae bacterium]|nr:STAS domain-containing protein [Pontiellaceae bacterium]